MNETLNDIKKYRKKMDEITDKNSLMYKTYEEIVLTLESIVSGKPLPTTFKPAKRKALPVCTSCEA